MRQIGLFLKLNLARAMMKNRAIIRIIKAGFFSLAMIVFSLPVFVQPVLAQEVIRSFSSDVVLLKDGSVDVIEIIEVRAEGNKIKRGIYRDIPTVMKTDFGSNHISKLEVISVKKNGKDEPFFIEDITNAKRIYIGQSNVFLEHGIYSYEIRYSMTRQARRFENHDELYWNATGNFWDFPIEKASANITLPDGAVIEDITGYTGAFGESGSDLKVVKTSRNSATYTATRPLVPYEGMSIAAKFQKGILDEPPLTDYINDRLGLFLPLIMVILIFSYYYFAWNKVGRDPKKGVIIPLFHPPKDFSPALVHYVHKMGWKKDGWSAFSAALINLGAKGLITIDKKNNSTKISRTNKRISSLKSGKLPAGEEIIYDLVKSKNPFSLNKTNGKKILKAKKEFIEVIGAENRNAYFKLNIIYVIVGFAISLVGLFLMMFSGVLEPIYLVEAVGIGVVLGLISALFGSNKRGAGNARFILIVWVLIIGTNLSGTVFATIVNHPITPAVIASISIVLINVIFAIIMRAATIHGRKVMDQIDGFKMYLETAEKEWLNMVDEPEMSVARFESILPYAIALGVEKPWSKHFEGELARNTVLDAKTDYRPIWYNATNFSTSDLSKSMGAMASGMSASMIASMPASSSSSGFSSRGSSGSSGGSSGGGGGGGGGGGW